MDKGKQIIIAEGIADNFIVRKIGLLCAKDIFEKIGQLIEEYGGDPKKNTEGKQVSLILIVADRILAKIPDDSFEIIASGKVKYGGKNWVIGDKNYLHLFEDIALCADKNIEIGIRVKGK